MWKIIWYYLLNCDGTKNLLYHYIVFCRFIVIASIILFCSNCKLFCILIGLDFYTNKSLNAFKIKIKKTMQSWLLKLFIVRIFISRGTKSNCLIALAVSLNRDFVQLRLGHNSDLSMEGDTKYKRLK